MEDLKPQQLEDVVKKVTRTIVKNTDMRVFLGIDKALTDYRRTKRQRFKFDRDRRAPREKTQKVRRYWKRRYPRLHQKTHS